MTTDQVNYLNIGLMLVALVAAFILPFEVFLISYAILGPLHYLTEISWLHDRKYFSPGKLDWVPLVVMGFAILLGAEFVLGPTIMGFMEDAGLTGLVKFFGEYGYSVTFIAFGMALGFILFKDWTYRGVCIVVLLLAAYFFHEVTPAQINSQRDLDQLIGKYSSPYYKIFAVYLPTLLHVYVFTGAFIIFGALKRSSRTGYISFLVFIFCAFACFIFFRDNPGILAGDWARTNYEETFKLLSVHFLDDFGGMDYVGANNASIFTNPFSIMTARFIAFAYTYHYLNWFSKTSIIRWHKVPKARFIAVILAWVASFTLYFIDYKIGFSWLFLLSFLHVLLEFPLNHQSFIGIGQEVRKRFGSGTKAGAQKAS